MVRRKVRLLPVSEFKEAVVLIAKCGESHKSYGIRMEKTGADRWLTTWAFPIKDSSAKREGYDKIQVKGDISFSDDYPGCPYCGRHGLTLCPCGHFELYHYEKQRLYLRVVRNARGNWKLFGRNNRRWSRLLRYKVIFSYIYKHISNQLDSLASLLKHI